MASRHQISRMGLVACSISLLCATGFAQIASQSSLTVMQNQQNAKDQPTGKDADKAFVKKAMECDMTSVEAAQLALQKSSNEQVKQFAQHILDDHAKVGDQINPVASQVGVKAPKEPAKDDRKMIAKLQTLSGPDFDNAYVKYMLKYYETNAAAFKQEMSSGQIPQVKDLATKDDPSVESDLQMIQGIAKTLNVSDSGV
jgi:putative membrane protein